MSTKLIAYALLVLSTAGVYYYAGKYGRRLWDHFTSTGRRR
jgi:hypothetical protein